MMFKPEEFEALAVHAQEHQAVFVDLARKKGAFLFERIPAVTQKSRMPGSREWIFHPHEMPSIAALARAIHPQSKAFVSDPFDPASSAFMDPSTPVMVTVCEASPVFLQSLARATRQFLVTIPTNALPPSTPKPGFTEDLVEDVIFTPSMSSNSTKGFGSEASSLTRPSTAKATSTPSSVLEQMPTDLHPLTGMSTSMKPASNSKMPFAGAAQDGQGGFDSEDGFDSGRSNDSVRFNDSVGFDRDGVMTARANAAILLSLAIAFGQEDLVKEIVRKVPKGVVTPLRVGISSGSGVASDRLDLATPPYLALKFSQPGMRMSLAAELCRWCVEAGHPELLCDPNAGPASNKCVGPLHIFCAESANEAALIALEQGADPHALDSQGRTALDVASAAGSDTEVLLRSYIARQSALQAMAELWIGPPPVVSFKFRA